MPRVKLDYVVSFSSEDSENPAKNLLAYDVSKKKWLCSTGEPSCSVVLQLTHAVQISTVHIGAYHAALVEVLVGRSEAPNDQYEVLVPSSVFVSPLDSRRGAGGAGGAGVERVRSFGGAQLAAAAARRWDRVRVVCSQPYNKHCKYGLSFVHIFESEAAAPPPPPAAPAVAARVPLSAAAAASYSSDEDDFKPGELFAQHLQRTSAVGTSKDTGAQIRQASSQALRNISDSSTKLVKTPISKTGNNRSSTANDFNSSRERNTLMYDDDDDRPHAKIDSVVQRHKNEKEQETKKKEAVQNLFKKDKHGNTLEAASKNFKEFLDNDDRKDSSRSKESSRDNDKRSNNDGNKESRDDRRHNDLNNSRNNTIQDEDRKNKDKSNNSRTKNSTDDVRRNKDMNNSKNDGFRDNGRRNKDEEKASQSRTKVDTGAGGESRKRQHFDDRQKTKDVLRAGPVSDSPHTLLRHVVFALSGYENPRRARLRDRAAALGARCRRDWSPDCTHLICAFPNTPKLRTVRSSPQGGDCIAVRGEWVERCCEERRLLPWQWFATEPRHQVAPPAGWDAEDKPASGLLDLKEIPVDTTRMICGEKLAVVRHGAQNKVAQKTENKPASDCDTDDEIEKVLQKQKKQRTDRSPSPQPHTSRAKSPKAHSSRERSPKPQTSRERSPRPQTSRERSPKPYSSREKSPRPHTSKEKSPKPTSRDRSPHRKDKSKSKQSLNYSNMSSDSDVAFVKDERIQGNITIDSGESTDEEKPTVKEKVDKGKVLPDFFDGYTFVIDAGVESAGFDKELLERYIRAYGGLVIDVSQMESDSEVSYVLSAGAGAGPAHAPRGVRVRADWVWRCHADSALCPVDEYAL